MSGCGGVVVIKAAWASDPQMDDSVRGLPISVVLFPSQKTYSTLSFSTQLGKWVPTNKTVRET